MAEIIYLYEGNTICSDKKTLRWIGADELDIFNEHLILCGQKPITPEVWKSVYAEGTEYCLLFEDGLPVARACVEKYSEDRWEVGDVRVAKHYRNKGLAYEASVFVLNYIIGRGKWPTIRTEEDNIPMQRVIAKMGFRPLA